LNPENKNNEIFGFLLVIGVFSKHRLTIQSNQIKPSFRTRDE
jgi:hypothetical protein